MKYVSIKKILRKILKVRNRKKILRLIKKLKPQSTNVPLIRIGPKGDGGYLLPNDLQGIYACFSPGTGPVYDFEVACAKRGMKIFMADASVEAPKTNFENIHFKKTFIGSETNKKYTSINDWILKSNIPPDTDLMLQMDIEGDEYDVINAMNQSLLSRFRIIIIEFHQLQNLFYSGYLKRAENTFRRLLNQHTCVHIHPNNYKAFHKEFGLEIPRVAEFTFYRNDRISKKQPKTIFPDPLDEDNTNNPTMVLPKIWYTE